MIDLESFILSIKVFKDERSELGGQPKYNQINLLPPPYKVPFGDLGVFLYRAPLSC
ncbi:hypothetical protein [Paulownia witches'-broom phytoplasma]|uniref:hypothetical protein n=1 Tax=Paulownia witches'-broom phytoplasma TaxID=39647 RepID=UPI002D1F7B44|nr:hypothetical protein PAWBP_7630 [Paulownia witches'-broom phytoplasma]